jgi:hypothetical protein
MSEKPRIRMIPATFYGTNRWSCAKAGTVGFGVTPSSAYAAWRRCLIDVQLALGQQRNWPCVGCRKLVSGRCRAETQFKDFSCREPR